MNKSSRVTILSKNIGERNIELSKKKLVSDTVVDLIKIVEEERKGAEKLKKELGAFQHLLLDMEMENVRQKVLTFQMSKLDTKIINQKHTEVFNKLDSAAKINIALGFVLQKIVTSKCRYVYAHENNTLFEFDVKNKKHQSSKKQMFLYLSSLETNNFSKK